MGVETLLNIISIALQNRKKKNQESLNKQMASATPPLIKDKKPLVQSAWAQQIQEFKNRIKMLKRTESVEVTQLKGSGSTTATPPKETESV